MKILPLLLCFLLAPALGSAQEADAYVGFGGGFTEGLGLRNPNFSPVVGSAFALPGSVTVSLEAAGDTAHKIDAGSGTEFTSNARVYWKRGSFQFGAGITFAREFTNEYDKTAWHPRGGVGYRNGAFSILGEAILPEGDVQNGLWGGYVRVEGDAGRRFTLRYEMQIDRFHETTAGVTPGTPLVWLLGSQVTATLLFHVRPPSKIWGFRFP